MALWLALVLLACRGEAKIRVDGQWSPWSTLESFCVDPNNRQNLVTCGGGVRTKYRSCTMPAPQGGGATCQPYNEGGKTISDRKDFPCQENPCALPEQFLWSEWSDCSARCGKGLQKRFKMCGSVRRRLPGHTACHEAAISAGSTTPLPQTIPPSTIPTPATPAPPPTAAPYTGPPTTTTSTTAGSTTTNADTTTTVTTTTVTVDTTTTTIVDTTTTTTVVGVTTTTTPAAAAAVTTTAAAAAAAPPPAAAAAASCTDPCECFKPSPAQEIEATAGGSCPSGAAGCTCEGAVQMAWIKFFELSESVICEEQPEPVMAEYNGGCQTCGTGCLSNWQEATIRPCNTWRYYGEDGFPDLWNHTNCPDPCLLHSCPKFAKCHTDSSTREEKVLECECQMGTVMKADNSSCIVPPPTTPTPRPIPTMETQIKSGVTAVSKTASSLIIIFLTITLILFLVFAIFDPMRVIHMCEEVSLLAAHLCMLPTMYKTCELEDEALCEAEPECRVISIAIHYFFTVCFMFMFLEAVHMYGLVASVVKMKGLLATKQNIVIGWGMPAFIILFNMCFEYDNYGGVYHCWLQMDKGLMYGQYIPIIVLVVTSFTIIEAAGAADEYPALPETDEVDKVTAQISQRTLLLILPLVFASFVCGTTAVYEQNPALYGIFTILNGVLGGAIFFFHVTSNKKTRALWARMCGKGKEKE